MRPTVGITAGVDDQGFYSLRPEYVRAAEAAGATPFVIAPGPPARARESLDHVDGLLLSGGADIDPALYGAAPHPATSGVRRERDEAEIALAQEAVRRDLPVLGICRGQQVLNVAFGGTLVQDIPTEVPSPSEHRPAGVERWQVAQEVTVLPGTRLREILGQERVTVNCRHHQSVAEPGRGLEISARAALDGVVEGLEAPGARFVVAVQWHPEAFWNRRPSFQPLFEAWVRAAGSR